MMAKSTVLRMVNEKASSIRALPSSSQTRSAVSSRFQTEPPHCSTCIEAELRNVTEFGIPGHFISGLTALVAVTVTVSINLAGAAHPSYFVQLGTLLSEFLAGLSEHLHAMLTVGLMLVIFAASLFIAACMED